MRSNKEMPVLSGEKGFTLVELVIVMAVISLILAIVIPNLRGMQQEGQLTQAEGELDTLKTAVTSYWRNNANVYPGDIQNSLTTASPSIVPALVPDPWKTDASGTYGYITGTDATFGDYFIIYTKGPKGDSAPTFNAATQNVTYAGSGRAVSNAPVVKN